MAKVAVVKTKTLYSCSECGAQSPKWQGQCPACNAWNTLVETVADTPGAHRYQALAATAPVQTLAQIEAADVPRFSTGVGEFDRVLGGGLVPGGVVLIGGDPGIGKSTLLLQSLAEIAPLAPRTLRQRRGVVGPDCAAGATLGPARGRGAGGGFAAFCRNPTGKNSSDDRGRTA